MTKLRFVAVAAAVVLLPIAGPAPAQAAGRPNIVVFMTDDQNLSTLRVMNSVMGNSPPDGGYYKLRGDETLPVWLSRSGYQT
jgi:hypothetical protein